MAGFISTIVPFAAAVLFAMYQAPVCAAIAGSVGAAVLTSFLCMRAWARGLARQRMYFNAVTRGDFADGSPEARNYLNSVVVTVQECDVLGTPNWLTAVNLSATLFGIVMLIWAIVRLISL